MEYTKENLKKRLQEIKQQGWIETQRPNNDGGVGNTLEDLLGIEENNLPLPDAGVWELKAQKETKSKLTLFHMEPEPREVRFVPQILLPYFGWKHQEAGFKYSSEEKSFRQTINKNYSNRGFRVQIDEENQQIFLDFSFENIDIVEHNSWSKQVKENIKNCPGILGKRAYWTFESIESKLSNKLTNCIFVQAKSRNIDGHLEFFYETVYFLENFVFSKFLDQVREGSVYVDFDSRTGHNHGTKFRLERKKFRELYETKEII